MDAVDWAGINGFLNEIRRVSVLANHARSPIIRLNVEGIPGDMGTMFTANTSHFVYIDTLLAQTTP
jgi:hypothetical protein